MGPHGKKKNNDVNLDLADMEAIIKGFVEENDGIIDPIVRKQKAEIEKLLKEISRLQKKIAKLSKKNLELEVEKVE